MYPVAPAELEQPRSCHQILGVTRGASQEELRLAFLKTAFACHPAHPLLQGDPAAACKRLREVTGAWAVLAGQPILGGQVLEAARPGIQTAEAATFGANP